MIVYRVRRRGDRSSLIAPSRYSLRYEKGEVVQAPEGSLGIFCFKRKRDAKKFVERFSVGRKKQDFVIYRVETIGRGKTPDRMSKMFYCWAFDEFYKALCGQGRQVDLGCFSCPVPEGVICYKKVKVLE